MLSPGDDESANSMDDDATEVDPYVDIGKLAFKKKQDLLNEFNWLDSLKVGTWLDAMDTTNAYIMGQCVKITNG